MNAFSFLAAGGWRAYSLDETGSSLPANQAPWHAFRAVRVDIESPAFEELRQGRDYIFQSEDSKR